MDTAAEEPQLIGHSYLPILSVDPETLRLTNRVLATEVNDLPVAAALTAGYLRDAVGVSLFSHLSLSSTSLSLELHIHSLT